MSAVLLRGVPSLTGLAAALYAAAHTRRETAAARVIRRSIPRSVLRGERGVGSERVRVSPRCRAPTFPRAPVLSRCAPRARPFARAARRGARLRPLTFCRRARTARKGSRGRLTAELTKRCQSCRRARTLCRGLPTAAAARQFCCGPAARRGARVAARGARQRRDVTVPETLLSAASPRPAGHGPRLRPLRPRAHLYARPRAARARRLRKSARCRQTGDGKRSKVLLRSAHTCFCFHSQRTHTNGCGLERTAAVCRARFMSNDVTGGSFAARDRFT